MGFREQWEGVVLSMAGGIASIPQVDSDSDQVHTKESTRRGSLGLEGELRLLYA